MHPPSSPRRALRPTRRLLNEVLRGFALAMGAMAACALVWLVAVWLRLF